MMNASSSLLMAGIDEVGEGSGVGGVDELVSQPPCGTIVDEEVQSLLANSTLTSFFPTDTTAAAILSNNVTVAVMDSIINITDGGFNGFHLRHDLGTTIFLSLIAAVVSIVTVLGNLLVLVAFFIDRNLRQPGNYLIVSLAMADFLIGVFSMPLYTMYLLLDESWPLGWVICDLWLSLDYAVCLVSQYTVFYITLDRFLVVKFTATYRLWLTKRRAKLIVAGIWTGSWLLFFPSITGWQFFVGERTVPPHSCYAQFMENPLFNTILVILYYWVTLVVISILYTFIYRKAWEMESRRNAERKRAEMLHTSLAQATVGHLGSSSTPVTSDKQLQQPLQPPQRDKSKQSVNSSGRSALCSETSDDDDLKSSTSSQSRSKSNANNNPGISMIALSPVFQSPDLSHPPALNNGNNNRNDHSVKFTKKKRKSNRLRDDESNCDSPLLQQKIANSDSKSDGFDAPLLLRKGNKNNNHRRIFKRDKRRPTSVLGNVPEFVRTNSSPPTMEQSRAAVVKMGMTALSSEETQDDSVVEKAAVPLRRTYSDLEPVLTVDGLLRVPVDELIGIEYIDDSPTNHDRLPASGNSIYRLRIEPNLCKKSKTFENLRSARAEKTIRKRIDRLLKRTRHQVSFSQFSFLRRRRHRSKAGLRPSNATTVTNITSETGDCAEVNGPVRHSKRDSSIEDVVSINTRISVYRKESCATVNSIPSNHGKHGGLASLASSNFSKKTSLLSSSYQSRASKALRMISFILGVFVITWTPYHIFALIKGFCSECVNDTLYAISYWFCYLNSPINPICYAVANKHFKRAFSKILHGNFKRV